VLLGDLGVAAEHRPARAALRLQTPAGAAGQLDGIVEDRAHDADLASQVDAEVVDERPRGLRGGSSTLRLARAPAR
jgi:hypothetical protein